MSEQPLAWSTWPELAAIITTPRNVRRTGTIAVVVGSVFFAMNQLGVILAGQATAIVWIKAALTYLTPLLVSNLGMLSATREPARQRAVRTERKLQWTKQR